VRKHLSRVSGGRLARNARASRSFVLAVSDVPGDRPDVIGSGPMAADPSRYDDAIGVMRARGIWERAPEAVCEYLEQGRAGAQDETPKPGDPCFAGVRFEIVVGNREARSAACEAARELGWRAVDLGEVLHGEARVAGQRLVAIASALADSRPTCLVAGGETSVVVRGGGRGGRNQELALASALAMSQRLEREGRRALADVSILAAGTDGSDGPTPAAGAWADSGTVGRGEERGGSAARALAANDSHGFFVKEGGLLHTGPTGTNVMDLALIAVGQPTPSPE
jgi:glycerate 2-kinase